MIGIEADAALKWECGSVISMDLEVMEGIGLTLAAGAEQ